jgi:pilus assembly protein Flp/PilA
MQAFHRFWRDESGATAIEYGLMASLIALAIIASVSALGSKVKTIFTGITTKI